jgi:hypothetical protein
LWFERANKTLQQVNHFVLLIDQFEFMGDVCFRINDDSIPSLKKSFKEEKNDKLRKVKQEHINAMKQFLELYQTYSITEYDYWDFKTAPTFSLFVEKFETKS